MSDTQQVTVDSFVRAESDTMFGRYVALGGFGRMFHIRRPTPIDQQDVIRMNRDTLYSLGIFDLASPLTITKPDSDGRFQSMQVISEDHSTVMVEYEPGEYELTQDAVGTRYVAVLVRTFMDPKDAEDIAIANALQDRIVVTQADSGTFDVPDWDQESLGRLRDAINVLAATVHDASMMFGNKERLDPIYHLMGTAYGWGGNPREEAIYVNGVPTENDGVVPHTLTITNAPVDGFWSVTVYNAKGFMEPNDRDTYSYNNVTAQKDESGGVTIHFGGNPSAPNYLEITPGWNYVIRAYKPGAALLDGTWEFPEAVPAA